MKVDFAFNSGLHKYTELERVQFYYFRNCGPKRIRFYVSPSTYVSVNVGSRINISWRPWAADAIYLHRQG